MFICLGLRFLTSLKNTKGQRMGNDSFEPGRTATNLLNNCTQPTGLYHSTWELRIALTSFHRIMFHDLTLQRLKKSGAEVFICPLLPLIRWWGWSIGGITMARGNASCWRKIGPIWFLPTIHLTRTGPGSNPGLRGDRSATNRLSHGTAF